MITYKCPYCGERISSDESEAGSCEPCPKCGQAVDVPIALADGIAPIVCGPSPRGDRNSGLAARCRGS